MNMYVSVFVYVCVYVEYSCLKLIWSNSTHLFFLFLQLKMNKVFLSDKAVCVCTHVHGQAYKYNNNNNKSNLYSA